MEAFAVVIVVGILFVLCLILDAIQKAYNVWYNTQREEIMDQNAYQLKVEGFMNPYTLEDKRNRMYNALFGLSGEVGECSDLWKKHVFHGHDFDREKFKLELSDIYFYLAEAASAIDCTLEEIAHINIAKLSKRYPTGKFTTQDSIEKKDQKGYVTKLGGMEYKVLPNDTYELVNKAENSADEYDGYDVKFNGEDK